jgi:hypothetical protein
VSKLTDESIQGALQSAVDQAKKHFADEGKSELVGAVDALQQFSPAAARWHVEQAEAQAAGDDAKLDALDRTFEVLEADAAAVLVEAGVMAQSEAESSVGDVLKILGKFIVGAAIAA